MNASFKRFLQLLFFSLDVLTLNLIYLLAQGIFEEGLQSQYFMRYSQYWLLMNGFWLLLSWFAKVYASDTISYFENFLRATFRVYVLWAGLNMLYDFLPRQIALSRSLVFTTVLGFLLGLIITRFLYLAIRE